MDEKRQPLALNEERLRLVVEAAPNGMIMVNSRGEIVLVNSQVERLFGYSREELLGQPIEVLVPVAAKSLHPGHRNQFFAEPHARAGRDLFGLRKDGSEVPVEIGLNSLSTEGERFVLASVVDITERKGIEAVLRNQIRELERLNEDFQRFTETLAHDLKSPLIGQSRVLDLMLRQELGTLNEKQLEVLDLIKSGNEELLNFIGVVFEVFRYAEGAQLCIHEFDVARLSVGCIAQFGRVAEANAIKIASSLPDGKVLVSCDEMAIRRVVMILLDQAIRFAPTVDGRVSFSLENTATSFTISIEDNGAGFTEEELGSLFHRLTQNRLGFKAKANTGLSLYLCRQIAEAHGGNISCISKEGSGAKFTVTIPIK